ncbi:uncharacterized protein LOC124312428 [Daphnia pulicaria]|uniref:uncharacterized protein LOC124312428 n=1 Tax=Daphnia pulicaria TaxID=35523 RepID=UPI001EEBEF37|nr:uncharacterized protein LOC124312428 [Daphnia pulicaria]
MMVRLTSATLLSILVLTCWSTSASASLPLEEQLQQLKDNYNANDIEMKRLLAEKNRRLGVLELKLESLLLAQQRNNPVSFDVSEIDRSTPVGTSDAILRQTTSKIPRSCADIKTNGHTSSGIYSIIGAKSMESVFCDFCKTTSDPSFQTLIGYEDVKSKPVYFHVQRLFSVFNQSKTPISFDTERINVGEAMNTSSGIFTAPVTGKYFFSYTGTVLFPKAMYRINFNVGLMKNGNDPYRNVIAAAHADSISTTDVQFETFAMVATQHLVKGDRIWVEVYPLLEPGVIMFFSWATQFNGFLLEEDISQSIKSL